MSALKKVLLSALILGSLTPASLMHAMQHPGNNRTETVSYLYYPYWGDAGHAELEVDGQCYTLKCGGGQVRSLQDRINKRRMEGGGLPFYQYVITVNKEEFDDLKKIVGQRDFYTCICSLEALNDLAQGANFSIPYPLRLSPLLSSHYLSLMKRFGSERVKEIIFYDSPGSNDLIDLGVFREQIIIGGVVCWSAIGIMIIITLVNNALEKF